MRAFIVLYVGICLLLFGYLHIGYNDILNEVSMKTSGSINKKMSFSPLLAICSFVPILNILLVWHLEIHTDELIKISVAFQKINKSRKEVLLNENTGAESTCKRIK